MAKIRPIRGFRPQRQAIKLTARQAFNWEVAYGDNWQLYKQQHPLKKFCENCFKAPATQRHHQIPISKGSKHSPSIIIDVCETCHNKFHGHLQRRRIKLIRS